MDLINAPLHSRKHQLVTHGSAIAGWCCPPDVPGFFLQDLSKMEDVFSESRPHMAAYDQINDFRMKYRRCARAPLCPHAMRAPAIDGGEGGRTRFSARG